MLMKIRVKKILVGALALSMVFSAAAAAPAQVIGRIGGISASAETYGDYEYSVLDDGTVEISKYNGEGGDIVIPETIDGKSVSSIGDSAFFISTSRT